MVAHHEDLRCTVAFLGWGWEGGSGDGRRVRTKRKMRSIKVLFNELTVIMDNKDSPLIVNSITQYEC